MLVQTDPSLEFLTCESTQLFLQLGGVLSITVQNTHLYCDLKLAGPAGLHLWLKGLEGTVWNLTSRAELVKVLNLMLTAT